MGIGKLLPKYTRDHPSLPYRYKTDPTTLSVSGPQSLVASVALAQRGLIQPRHDARDVLLQFAGERADESVFRGSHDDPPSGTGSTHASIPPRCVAM